MSDSNYLYQGPGLRAFYLVEVPGGSGAVTFSIRSPTSGFTVNVDVTVGAASCSTSFTPQ